MLRVLFLLLRKHPLRPLWRQDLGTKSPSVHPESYSLKQQVQKRHHLPSSRAEHGAGVLQSTSCGSVRDSRKSNDFPSQLVLLHYADNVL